MRTYFINSSRGQRMSTLVGRSGGRSGGRSTLAAVVFGLVQARNKEKQREANGGFNLTSCSAKSP